MIEEGRVNHLDPDGIVETGLVKNDPCDCTHMRNPGAMRVGHKVPFAGISDIEPQGTGSIHITNLDAARDRTDRIVKSDLNLGKRANFDDHGFPRDTGTKKSIRNLNSVRSCFDLHRDPITDLVDIGADYTGLGEKRDRLRIP